MSPPAAVPSKAPPFAARLAHVATWTAFAAISLWLAADYVQLFALSRVVSWDEGYVMISLRGFLDGNALYDEVFTQYGPAYYFLRLPLFQLLDLPLAHDTVRQLSMLTWGSAAALLGVIAFRLTRSAFLGWWGFLQGVVHLSALANEAGHPQELIVWVLCASVFAHAIAPTARATWWLIGGGAALLVLTKINVGAFALLGLLVFWLSQALTRSTRLVWWIPVVAMLLPPGLMWRHLHEPWAMAYAAAASVAVACLVATLLQTRPNNQGGRRLPLRDVAVVFVGVCLCLLLATWLRGSSVYAMLDGLVLAPVRLAAAFVTPLDADPIALAGAALAGCGWAIWAWRHHHGRPTPWVGFAKLGFAVAGAIALVSEPAMQLVYLAPWAWLALAPGERAAVGTDQDATNITPRFIAALAAFQLLQAYPVAGSQVAWSTLLLLPLYLLSLRDAGRDLMARFGASRPSSRSLAGDPQEMLRGHAAPASARVRSLLGILACSGLLWISATVWMALPRLRVEQRTLQPLSLPGAQSIRIAPEGVALYQSVTRYLVANSDGFTSYPGYHSLHFWTGIAPPTQANVTVWDLLSDAQQLAIVNRLASYDRPRIVLTRDVRAQLQQRGEHTWRPFERAMLIDYEAVAEIGPCVILAPRSEAGG